MEGVSNSSIIRLIIIIVIILTILFPNYIDTLIDFICSIPKKMKKLKKVLTSSETVLVIGSVFLLLRLIFPPYFKFPYKPGPNYSLALLHALSIGITTILIFYLLNRKKKQDEEWVLQRLKLSLIKWNRNLDEREITKQNIILKNIFEKYLIEDKKTKKEFFTLLDFTRDMNRLPTKEELEKYSKNSIGAVRDFLRMFREKPNVEETSIREDSDGLS
jgi:hypothetical protein